MSAPSNAGTGSRSGAVAFGGLSRSTAVWRGSGCGSGVGDAGGGQGGAAVVCGACGMGAGGAGRGGGLSTAEGGSSGQNTRESATGLLSKQTTLRINLFTLPGQFRPAGGTRAPTRGWDCRAQSPWGCWGFTGRGRGARGPEEPLQSCQMRQPPRWRSWLYREAWILANSWLGALSTPSWYGHDPRLKGLLLVANWIGRQKQNSLAARHLVHSATSSSGDATCPYWKLKLGESPLATAANPLSDVASPS